MNVRLGADALATITSFPNIDGILRHFERGRHTWIEEDPAAVMVSPWYQQAGEGVQRRVRRLLAKPIPSGNRLATRRVELRVTAAPSGPLEMSPAVAEHWLGQPLQLLLEDPEGQGRLIELVLLHLDPTRVGGALGAAEAVEVSRSWRPLQGDGVFFALLPGGGADIDNEFRRKTASLPGYPPPNLFALADSDRAYPAAPDGATASRLRTAAAGIAQPSLEIPWTDRVVVLRKHEVENYVPGAALRTRTQPLWFAAWEVLSRAHQDHVDIKSGLRRRMSNRKDPGFKPNRRATWEWSDSDEERFWAPIGDATCEAMGDGQGAGVGRGLDPACLTIQDLLSRDGSGELDGILTVLLHHL